jgi:general secretion pathway protein B
MSYILDALKKAERERGISKVPTLATVHELRKVRRHYLWIIAGAILLSSVAIAWFFLASSKVATQQQTLAQTNTEANSGATLPSAEAGETSDIVKAPPLSSESSTANHIIPTTNAPSPKPALPASEAVTHKSVDAEPKAGAPLNAVAVPQESDEESSDLEEYSSEEEPDAGDSAESAPAPEQIHAETKPGSLQEAANKMILNIHVYSEVKGERKVFINGKKYLEGDYVDGQYLLKEITPEGAVLSYEGDKVILRPGRK